MKQLTGIGLKIGSAFLFTLMATLIKTVSQDLPIGQQVFSRSFFALFPIFAMLAWRGEFRTALRTDHLSSHLLRALISTAAMFCVFGALRFLPLPEATAIGYAAPLVTVVLAVLLLKEHVRIYRWSAVLVGLLGVLVILWPHLDGGTHEGGLVGAGLALGGACGTALGVVQVRRLIRTEGTPAVVFYFALLSTAVGLATLPFGWVMPTAEQAVTLVLIGLLGGTGQLLLTQSYRTADASLIAPFDYTTILYATVLGYLVFGDVPTVWVATGSVIVIASGVFVILRERHLGIVRARARKAMPPA